MDRAYKGAMTAPNRRMLWLLARAQRRVAAASDVNLADLELTSTQAGASQRDCGHGQVMHICRVCTHCEPLGQGFVGEQPSAHAENEPQS